MQAQTGLSDTDMDLINDNLEEIHASIESASATMVASKDIRSSAAERLIETDLKNGLELT